MTARALELRSRVSQRLGEGRQGALAAEAVALLEQEKPGPALVAAYAQLANAQCIAGAHTETIAAADRAVACAERLGLPEPARALGYRGLSRVYLGDVDGLAEMEHALALLIERGAGDYAAALQNNLAVARYPLQGAAHTLASYEETIAFCKQRGLTGLASVHEAACPDLVAELGRPEEALDRAAAVASVLEAVGEVHHLNGVRATELTIRLARGEQQAPRAAADWLVESARAIGAVDSLVTALAAAATALAIEEPEQACELLSELERAPAAHESTYYARELTGMLRTALVAGDLELAKRLVRELEPRYPLHEHALCAGRAQLAEAAGDHAQATAFYAEAAEGWREFGNVPERAYALLGQGRCLARLGKPEAAEPLREARALFASMGYKPALAETDSLLGRAAAAAS